MANCTRCNAEIPDESRFCPNCGAIVQPQGQSESPQAPQPQTPQPYRFGQDPPPASSPSSGATREARNMAALAHLSAFAGLVVPLFGNVLGPLIVWLLKREESPFIDAHGKAALNFQISVTIYMIVSAILIIIVIGFFLLIALGIFAIVMTIIAAIKAGNGEDYVYPLAIRFIN